MSTETQTRLQRLLEEEIPVGNSVSMAEDASLEEQAALEGTRDALVLIHRLFDGVEETEEQLAARIQSAMEAVAREGHYFLALERITSQWLQRIWATRKE